MDNPTAAEYEHLIEETLSSAPDENWSGLVEGIIAGLKAQGKLTQQIQSNADIVRGHLIARKGM